MRIDSHHHFWEYDAAQYPWIDASKHVLQRDFTPPDLQPILDRCAVDAVVTVQARQTLDETRWLLHLAAEYPFIRGVVGWIPLQSEAVGEELASLTHHPALKGVRHVIQDEPDDRFMLGEAFNRGVRELTAAGLVYDILIYAKHLAATIEFVDRHPAQPFVLDHIAKPTIRATQFDDRWRDEIADLARRENVACKFSGVITEVRDRDWNLETLRPYWDAALNAFGAERLMFGSDWPVCLLRTDYARWVEAVESLANELSESEQEAFWGGNAKRIYRLA